jgi:ATP-dependent DNA helicase PIF1
MEFSKEQKIAIQKFNEGNNIFITGPGGSGKTYIIKMIKQIAEERQQNIQICALTGCAAVLLNCNAKTVHSWAGIGLGNNSLDVTIIKIRKYLPKLMEWIKLDILVIDEISMMSKKLFELLDGIGKALRRNNLPFGGIQLVFSGDFFQLPPVGKNEDSAFCFESPLWFEAFHIENHIQLKKIFRQNDIIFKTILNEIRVGKITRKSQEILSQQIGKDSSLLYIKPTKIFPIKSKVNEINTIELNNLITTEFIFKSKYISVKQIDEIVQYELNRIENNLLCDKVIKLKVGAQVMCIVNMDTLCNGSQGIITRFENGIPVVKFTNGIEMAMNYHIWQSENIIGVGVSQIPLILAWAITIHKSQGATLDFVELDIGSNIFECGQSYVALSRVKSLDGLYISLFDPKKIKVNRKVRDFYSKIDNLII